MVCRQARAQPLLQAYWPGSACRQGRIHALSLGGRPAYGWLLELVPAYFAFQIYHGQQRPCWMNLCLPSRLFVQVLGSAWGHFLLCPLFRCSHFPLASACGSFHSSLLAGNFPGCCCSVRSCPHAASAGCRALAVPHACLGFYLLVRFDCYSSDPPSLFFPVTSGRSPGGLLIFRKQPPLRPVYVPFSREGGIDQRQVGIISVLTFFRRSIDDLVTRKGIIRRKE